MTYLEAGIKVLEQIIDSGFEAFFVGGFVRDYILGVDSNDIDIATNALPNQIANIFKVVNTGIKYNCVTINYEGYTFETTTYRIEGAYTNNRHPSYIVGESLSDDLKRRDFTINAMAMDKNMKVIDLFDGLNDLKKGIIRTVYEPQRRFTEDALRMLRAAYFASKLGFEIDNETLLGMKSCSYLVQNLSSDRICWELEKLINSNYPKIGINYLIETNIAPYLSNFKKGIYLFNEKNLDKISWIEFLAICYFDDVTELSNIHLKSNISSLVTLAINVAKENKKNEFSRHTLFEYGLNTVLVANKVNVLLFGSKNRETYINHEYSKLPIHSMSELAVTGIDIIDNITIKENRMISQILKEVKLLVLNDKLDNSKESILKYIKKHF